MYPVVLSLLNIMDRSRERTHSGEKVNFQPSGKLAEDTNTYKGVVIKYNEPNDAHLPKTYWRLYPFKVSRFCICVCGADAVIYFCLSG